MKYLTLNMLVALMYLSVFLLGVVVDSVVVFVIVVFRLLVARGLLRGTPQHLTPRTNLIILLSNFVAGRAGSLLRVIHIRVVVLHVALLLVPIVLTVFALLLGRHHVFTNGLHKILILSHLLKRFIHRLEHNKPGVLRRQLQEFLQVIMLVILFPDLPLLEQLKEVFALHDIQDLLLVVFALHFLLEEDRLEEVKRGHIVLE